MRSILLFCFFTIPFYSQAQSDTITFHHSKMMSAMIQSGISVDDFSEGVKYTPVVLSGDFHIPFYKSRNNFGVAANLIPQFAIVQFGSDTRYELGLGFWVEIMYLLGAKNLLSGNAGSGLHYISDDIERQVGGFIFCNNFNLQYQRMLFIGSRQYSLGFNAGYRHLSNAETRFPNRGINHFLFGVSFARLFK